MIKDLIKEEEIYLNVYSRANNLYIMPVKHFSFMFDTWLNYEIHTPLEEYKNLYTLEGLNIVEDSITVTESNPNTINSISGISNNKPLLIQYPDHIKRFGKNETTIPKSNDEAYKAYSVIQKSRRNSGHKLELKIIGVHYFKVGRWCVVTSLSLDIESFMFITNVNHSFGAGNEWITTLEMVDYPPEIS